MERKRTKLFKKMYIVTCVYKTNNSIFRVSAIHFNMNIYKLFIK